MVAVIMVRILHRDLTRYNNEQLSEEEQKEETGWKVRPHTLRARGTVEWRRRSFADRFLLLFLPSS